MKAKVNFITLAVKDLAASKLFYEQAFEFPVGEVSHELCLFNLEDDFYLALQQTDAQLPQATALETSVNSAGFILSHQTGSVEEVDAIVAQATGHGAVEVSTLREEWGYAVTITDLDGHHWEIVYTAHDATRNENE
ncbi:VOC family protein [Sphingobacterium oryzagri]|uniref:VOC family protein n=1 Tax=Sphingobacterium oryzagri TaxID=3025669 RepID=A0ABY7WMX2_9SPHI|nr:VOC family protein [Sphingobacterium sp. KACC 22765]WDF69670.1 VOC family protein [Sphingobacterium sp. KACC 22765]